MLMEEVKNKLEALAEEVSEREQCRLYDLEFVTSQGRRVLRIYVEGIDGAVSIDQCAEISRALSLLLDVEDPIPGGHYDLEVSSPGVERPLRLPWHFERALGEKIKLKSSSPLAPSNRELKKGENVRSLVGQLRQVEKEKIVLETEKDLWSVPFDVIHKANVVFGFHQAVQKKKSRKTQKEKTQKEKR